MKYNSVSKVDFKISEISFGAWQLGNGLHFSQMSDEDAIDLVQKALEAGVTLFDTAPNYGGGNSERLLGLALKDCREKVFISTKFGHSANGMNFDVDFLEVSVRDSLKRLNTTYLDSVILHNPGQEMLYGTHPIYDEFKRLKSLGLIKYYGVSIDHPHELEIVLKHNDVDVIELMFNIVHQSPKMWLDEVHKQGILLLAKVPFDSGWLTGKYNKDTKFKDIRSRWTKENKEVRAKIIEKVKEITGDDIIHASLRFILNFDGVTTVIPGTKNVQQLESNINTTYFELTDEQQKRLENLYDEIIKDLDTPW